MSSRAPRFKATACAVPERGPGPTSLAVAEDPRLPAELEDEGEAYESIEEIWPDYPTKEDFFFNEDEY